MADNLTVSVALELAGANTFNQAIDHVESSLKGLQGTLNNLSTGVAFPDFSSVSKDINEALQSIQSLFNMLKNMTNTEVKLKLTIQDGDIQQAKHLVESIFSEAMAKSLADGMNQFFSSISNKSPAFKFATVIARGIEKGLQSAFKVPKIDGKRATVNLADELSKAVAAGVQTAMAGGAVNNAIASTFQNAAQNGVNNAMGGSGGGSPPPVRGNDPTAPSGSLGRSGAGLNSEVEALFPSLRAIFGELPKLIRGLENVADIPDSIRAQELIFRELNDSIRGLSGIVRQTSSSSGFKKDRDAVGRDTGRPGLIDPLANFKASAARNILNNINAYQEALSALFVVIARTREESKSLEIAFRGAFGNPDFKRAFDSANVSGPIFNDAGLRDQVNSATQGPNGPLSIEDIIKDPARLLDVISTFYEIAEDGQASLREGARELIRLISSNPAAADLVGDTEEATLTNLVALATRYRDVTRATDAGESRGVELQRQLIGLQKIVINQKDQKKLQELLLKGEERARDDIARGVSLRERMRGVLAQSMSGDRDAIISLDASIKEFERNVQVVTSTIKIYQGALNVVEDQIRATEGEIETISDAFTALARSQGVGQSFIDSFVADLKAGGTQAIQYLDTLMSDLADSGEQTEYREASSILEQVRANRLLSEQLASQKVLIDDKVALLFEESRQNGVILDQARAISRENEELNRIIEKTQRGFQRAIFDSTAALENFRQAKDAFQGGDTDTVSIDLYKRANTALKEQERILGGLIVKLGEAAKAERALLDGQRTNKEGLFSNLDDTGADNLFDTLSKSIEDRLMGQTQRLKDRLNEIRGLVLGNSSNDINTYFLKLGEQINKTTDAAFEANQRIGSLLGGSLGGGLGVQSGITPKDTEMARAQAGFLKEILKDQEDLVKNYREQGVVLANLENQYSSLDVDRKKKVEELIASQKRLLAVEAEVAAKREVVSKFQDLVAKGGQHDAVARFLGFSLQDIQQFAVDAVASMGGRVAPGQMGEIDYLNKKIVDLKDELQDDAGFAPALDRARTEYEKTGETIEKLSGVVGKARAELQNIDPRLKNLDKAINSVDNYKGQLGDLNEALRFIKANINSTDPDALMDVAEAYRFLSSSAQKGRTDIRQATAAFDEAERAFNSLTAEQKQQRVEAALLAEEYRKLGNEAARIRPHMAGIEKDAARAGQGFGLYREEVGRAVFEQLKFVSSMTVVSSVIFGLEAAFRAVIDESKNFSRTMTVMQSDMLSFTQINEEMQRVIRQASVTFGADIAKTSEIVKQFGSAGLKAEDALRGLNVTMQLVNTTSGQAEETSRAIAGIYQVFGNQIQKTSGSMSEFNVIADTLTSVYQNHQAELDEMVQGLRFAASTGNSAGFSFQQISAYLAVLNDNLIKSGNAGRGLQAVFAQMAAKGPQIADAFNIKIDPNSPLSSQFIDVLKGVNRQMSSGAITAKELDQTFKIFDRQGARSFVTLVQNIEQVEGALKELESESSGITNQLNQIIDESAYTQFYKAKQAALDLARDGLEPLGKVIKFVADGIQQVREFIQTFGVLGKFAQMFVFIGIALGGFLQIVIAAGGAVLQLSRYLALNSSVAARAAQNYIAASTALTAMGVSSQTAAAAGQRAGAAITFLTGAVNKLLLALTVIAAIGMIWAAFSDSVAEIDSRMAKLSSTSRDLSTSLKKLDEFESKLANIKSMMDTSAVSSVYAGEQIRKAFDGVGENLISQYDVIFMSNEQLAKSFDKLFESTRRQVAEQRAELQLLRKETFEEFSNEFKSKLGAESRSTGAVGAAASRFSVRQTDEYEKGRGAFATKDILQNIVALEKAQIEAEKIRQRIASGEKDFRIVGRNINKTVDIVQTALEKEKNDIAAASRGITKFRIEYLQMRADFVNQGMAAGKSRDELEKQFKDAVIEAYFPNYDSDPEVRSAADKFFSGMQDAINQNIRITPAKLFDADDFTSSARSIFGNMAIPFTPSVSTKFVDDLLFEKEQFGQVEKKLAQAFAPDSAVVRNGLMDGIDAFKSVMGDNPIDWANADTISAALKDGAKSFSKSKEARDMARTGSLPVDFDDYEKSISEWYRAAGAAGPLAAKERDKALGTLGVDQGTLDTKDPSKVSQALYFLAMTDEDSDKFNRAKLSVEIMAEQTKVMEENFQNAAEGGSKISESLANSITNDNYFKVFTEGFKAMNDDIEKAVMRTTTLNAVMQKANAITTARFKYDQRRLDLTDLESQTGRKGGNAADLESRIASVLESSEKAIDIITDATQGRLNESVEDLGEKEKEDVKKLATYFKDRAMLRLEAAQDYKDIIMAQKEYNLEVMRQRMELQRSNASAEKTQKNLMSALAIAREDYKISMLNADLKLEEVKRTEALVGNLKSSLGAMSQLVALQEQLVVSASKYRDLMAESSAQLFDNLSVAKELLATGTPVEDMAGLNDKIIGSLVKVNRLTEQRRMIEDKISRGKISQQQYQSEIIENDKRNLDIYKDMVKGLESAKAKLKELREILGDRRPQILENINKELATAINSDTEALTGSLKKFAATSKVQFANLAQSIGVDFEYALINSDAAIDKIKRMVQRGEVSLRSLSARDRVALESVIKNQERQNQVLGRYRALQTDRLNDQFVRLEEGIANGKIKDVDKALAEINSTIEKAYSAEMNPGVDPAVLMERKIAAYERLYQIEEKVRDSVGDYIQKIMIEFNIPNADAITRTLAIIREHIESIIGRETDMTSKYGSLLDKGNVARAIFGGNFETRSEEIVGTFNEILEGFTDKTESLQKELDRFDKALAKMAGKESKSKKSGVASKVGDVGIAEQVAKDEALLSEFKSSGEAFGEAYVELVDGMGDVGYKFDGINKSTLISSGVFGIATGAYGDFNDVVNEQSEALGKARQAQDEYNDSLNVYGPNPQRAMENAYKEALREQRKFIDDMGDEGLGEAYNFGVNFIDGFMTGAMSKTAALAEMIFAPMLDAQFAFENATAYANYVEQLKEINKTFTESIDQATEGLSRNESNYYEYLNSIMEAEQARIQSRLDAEKQYQEELKNTEEIIKGIYSQANESFGSFLGEALEGFGSFASNITGSISDNFRNIAAEFALVAQAEMIVGPAENTPEAQIVSAVEQASKDIVAAIEKSKEDEKAKAQAGASKWLGAGSTGASAGTSGASSQAAGASEGSSGSKSGNDMQLDSSFQASATSALKMYGAGIASLAVGVGGLVIQGFSSIVGQIIGQGGDNVVMFFERFIKDMPEKIGVITDEILASVDEIFTVIVEGLPVLLDSLVENLPKLLLGLLDVLSQNLGPIISSLGEAIQKLFPKVVQILIKGAAVLVDVIVGLQSTLIQMLPSLIYSLITEIIKNLPTLIAGALKLVIFGTVGIIFDLITGIINLIPGVDIPNFAQLTGVFHDGGMIPGNQRDIPIMAQSGEGVLSRKGIQALGGASMLNELNRGYNPFTDDYYLNKFNDAGIVGGVQDIRNYPVSTGNTNNSDNRTITANIVVNDSSGNGKKIGNDIMDQVEARLARNLQDRRGPVSKVMKNK
jgi:hypothetical protein